MGQIENVNAKTFLEYCLEKLKLYKHIDLKSHFNEFKLQKWVPVHNETHKNMFIIALFEVAKNKKRKWL